MNELITSFSKYSIKDIPCPLRFIQGGTLDVGEDEDKHPVTLPSFYLGQYQVTQELYEVVMKINPSHYKGATRPVTNVSWEETKVFMEKLKKITTKEFRLPTESEWEYAARGGVHSQGFAYCGSDHLKQVGWYKENSGLETKPVGLLLPNELGLYDMSGNVYEWCADDWHPNFKDAPEDGIAWVDGIHPADRATARVVRGGFFSSSTFNYRSAYRLNFSPDTRFSTIGFRVVLAQVQEEIPPLSRTGSRA